MANIPVLDLGSYLEGQRGARERLASELDAACSGVGFYYLVNHGIPPDYFDMIFAEARRFHALSEATRLKIRQGQHYVGYVAPGGQRINNSSGSFDNRANRPDLVHSYHVNLDFPADHPKVQAGRRYYVQQPWPEDLPGFRENVMTYFRAVFALGQKLRPVYATALGAAPDYFAPSFVDALSYLRLSHYPPIAERAANQFGLGAHTDTGFLTLLPQSSVPGLEIQMPDGQWAPPTPMPGAFIVNAGQTLRRWSNDRFRATPHRALSPLGNVDRYAAPMFFSPSYDAIVVCITREPGEAAHHPSFKFGDHFDQQIASSYTAAANSQVNAA